MNQTKGIVSLSVSYASVFYFTQCKLNIEKVYSNELYYICMFMPRSGREQNVSNKGIFRRKILWYIPILE